MFELLLTRDVQNILDSLETSAKRLRRVRNALARLESNPRHPGLNSHPFHTLFGPLGEPISESYVENQTPAAWRIWWYYGPNQGEITVVALGEHP
jgi:hypothetical protein